MLVHLLDIQKIIVSGPFNYFLSNLSEAFNDTNQVSTIQKFLLLLINDFSATIRESSYIYTELGLKIRLGNLRHRNTTRV